MTIRATKLQPPVERVPWVRRPRLMGKLKLHEHGFLTVICAPAGFGKTVMMAQWCRALAENGRSFAWISLDPRDNDENVFVAHVEAALRPSVPDLNAVVRTLRSSPVIALDTVIAELCRATAVLPVPVTLFLDDLHSIDNPMVQRFIEQLVIEGGMHVVIASRMVPALPLGKMRMLGGVTEIGADDLRFDLEDANRFLSDKSGVTPEPTLLTDMVEKTEGWAAGLQLASLQLAANGTVAGFSGGAREVTEFLMQEVFGVLDPDLQDFLLTSALLERFSAESCRAILRRPDAEDMIAAIEARQLFIVRLDPEGHWFRYHQIFRDFLRRQLERRSPLAIAPLHLAAAEWLLEQGSETDAVRHTLLAGDERRAAAIVERLALPMIADCRFREIEELLSQLPRKIVSERIRLQFVIIWISVHSSQARRATAALARAYALLDADPGCGDDRGTLPPVSIRIELAVLDAAVASTCERFREARDKAYAALRLLPISAWFLQAVAFNIIGYNEYALGNVDAGRKAVLSALHAHNRSGSILGLVICNCYLAAIERSAGRLDLSRTYIDAAIRSSQDELGPDSYGEALAKTLLMDLAYETGNTSEAESLLETVRPLIEGGVVVILPIVSVPTYARLLQYRGKNEEALALLTRVDAGEDGIYVRLAAVTMHERVRLLIRMKRAGEARAVLDRFRGQLPPGLPDVLLDFVRLAETRVLLAEGRPTAAREILDVMVGPLRASGRVRRLILALLLRAQCGAAEEPDDLAEALRLAKVSGFRRLVLDEFPALHPQIEAFAAGAGSGIGALSAFAAELLADVADGVESAGSNQGATAGLTSREADVLEKLCAGASNRDLAIELRLSEPTVKWHLKNIFGKLGVSNRLQAVRKAQDFGLVK